MNTKILLLLVIVFTLGTIVLPQTVSLFAGQHYWYNISDRGNQIPCEKCHADIAEEVENSPYHKKFACDTCHREVKLAPSTGEYRYAYDYGYGIAPSPGKEAHAASTLSCLMCHMDGSIGDPDTFSHSNFYYSLAEKNNLDIGQTCPICHPNGDTNIPPPIAGGFGVTGKSWDTGSYAAHHQFVLDAMNNSLMESANEACIACHTHVAVRINFTHYRVLEFNVTFDSFAKNFIVDNFNVNKSTVVTSVIWGNTTGYGSTNYWSGWPGQ